MTLDEYIASLDTSMLGKTFKTHTPFGEQNQDSGYAMLLQQNPELMAALGLSGGDFQNVAGRNQHDGYDEGYVNYSDKAQNALNGFTLSRTGYEGMQDGRAQVMRDAQGRVVNIGDPYSYDPAGDLKDAALRAAALMAAGYGASSMLGLNGAGAAAGSAGMGGLDAVAAAEAGAGGLSAAGGAAGGAAGAGSVFGGSLPEFGMAGLSGGGGLGGGGTLGSLGSLGSGGGALSSIGSYLSGSGGLSLAGNLLGGYMQNRAAGKASDALLQAGRESNALQKQMYDQTRADYAPYREAGYSALGQIQNLLKDPSAITQQADYKFGLDQGRNNLENSASARGMTYSGAQAKALNQYGQDYAGSKLNESYNRLAGIAGIGQQATNSTSTAGMNYGNQAGNTLQNMGNARASGYVGQGNAWNNAFGSIINDYNDWDARKGRGG